MSYKEVWEGSLPFICLPAFGFYYYYFFFYLALVTWKGRLRKSTNGQSMPWTQKLSWLIESQKLVGKCSQVSNCQFLVAVTFFLSRVSCTVLTVSLCPFSVSCPSPIQCSLLGTSTEIFLQLPHLWQAGHNPVCTCLFTVLSGHSSSLFSWELINCLSHYPTLYSIPWAPSHIWRERWWAHPRTIKYQKMLHPIELRFICFFYPACLLFVLFLLNMAWLFAHGYFTDIHVSTGLQIKILQDLIVPL